MRHLTNDLRHQIRRHGRGTSRVLALFLALTMVTSLGLDISTINTVYASESDTYTCGQEAHEHSIKNGCYALTCDEEETNGHTHTLDCYEDVDPTCGIEASDPVEEHHHDLDCYGDKVLTCENENEDHEHTLECYDLGDPTCGIDETDGSEGHTHDLDCYKDAEAGCGKEETDGHKHTEDCYNLEETICGKEEHEHTDECKATADEPENDRVANADYDKEWIEAADEALEDIDDDQIAALVAVAQSQDGYAEQIKDDTDEDIYTLYAHEFYNGNNDSQDWNTVFAMWALDKAEISLDTTGDSEDDNPFPVRNKLSAWIDAVDDTDSYISVVDDGLSELAQGDIAFLDLDGDEEPDHVAIVTSVQTDDDDYPNAITVVAGDIDAETLSYFTDADDNDADVDTDADAADTVAEITLDGTEYDDDAGTYLAAIVTAFVQTSDYADSAAEPEDPEDDKAFDIDADTVHGTTYTSGEASQSSIMLVAGNEANDTAGVDMSNYVTSATFKKKNGVIWEVATSFKTSDQVMGSINFDGVPVSAIKDSNKKIYIDLPEGIDCSKFENKQPYKAYDSKYSDTEPSGTYTYEKQEDGSYRIVLTLTDDYLNSDKIGDTIGGNLQFEFYWDVEKYPTQDKYKIEIGKWDGQIEIIPDKKEEEDDKNAKYGINKSTAADAFSYSDDGKTLYINYEITLTVKEAMTPPLNLKDVLEGEGFTYDTAYGIKVTGGNVQANYGTTQGDGINTQIQLWANDGSNTIPAGTYTLNYRVKSTVDASDPEQLKNLATQVHNKIQVPDGDDGITSEIWTNITKGTINKQGELVNGSDATYIDYTVYLNAGDIVANIKTPAKFTDTLPDTLELVGDVKVEQYNYKGVLQNTTKATVTDGKNISYTTPTGQYYYVITYRTKLKNSDIPLGGLTVKNDGKSTGGIDGSSSSEVEIPNHKLHKVSNGEPSLDTSTNTYTLYWKSTIDVEGSLKDYTYEDWASIGYTDTKWYFQYVTMSDAQRAAIVVKDANGNVVDSGKYTVTTSDHVSSWKDIDGNIINDGLFKMTFSEDVTGPVTLEYECTADMTNFNLNSAHRFTNYASLTDKNGNVDEDTAYKDITYHHGDPKKITKYGDKGKYDEGESGSITIEPGQKWIPWTIAVNGGQSLYSDLKITDTISDNLTYVDGSLWITINGQEVVLGEQGEWKNGVKWSIDGKTITMEIKKSAYSSSAIGNKYSNLIFIGYRTDLPDSFFTDDKITDEFSNHASLQINKEIVDSDYTQTVTRKVVGKNGSFDATTGTLTYEITINPEGSRLNKGNDLKVEDTLTTLYDSLKEFMQYVSLDSLELFTAVKDTDASTGKVTVKAGTLIRKLNQVDSTDSITVGEDYYYDDTTKTFTTWLPDETGYVIVAKYLVTQEVSADVGMKNTVKLTGSDSWSGEDSKTTLHQETSGTTYTKKDTVTVTKRDASSYNTKLSGAIFRLDYWDGSAWQTFTGDTTHSDGTITTGTNGTGTFQDIQYKTLYRLVETQAPDGYLINETPTYFIVVRKSNESTAKDDLPDSIAGESSYSKSAVGVYTVKDNITYDDGTVVTEFYANVTIDRYDEKDTTRTEPGQLRVIKKWVNSSGSEITDTQKLSTMPDVTVTLTKHVAKKALKFTIQEKGNTANFLQLKDDVNIGGYVYIATQQGDAWKTALDDSGISYEEISEKYSYYPTSYKIGPINKDTTIELEHNLYYNYGYCWKTDGGTAPSGTIDTVVSTETLKAATSWSHLWSELERGDGITYTLTETTVNGYTTTYQVNAGESTSTAPTFSLKTTGSTGDTATITNTAKKTSLKVKKVWNDGSVDHTNDTVTIYLLRGIKETGKDEITYNRVKDSSGNEMKVTLSYNLIENQSWKAIFTDLATEDENGNKYYYTVKEDPVPTDYIVSYEYGTDSSDSTDPDYPSQPIATVTNTKQYKMPETGGAGTLPYMLGGSAALISSMFAGCSMRRRRRDERRCD